MNTMTKLNSTMLAHYSKNAKWRNVVCTYLFYSLLDNAPNYLLSWVRYPKPIEWVQCILHVYLLSCRYFILTITYSATELSLSTRRINNFGKYPWGSSCNVAIGHWPKIIYYAIVILLIIYLLDYSSG